MNFVNGYRLPLGIEAEVCKHHEFYDSINGKVSSAHTIYQFCHANMQMKWKGRKIAYDLFVPGGYCLPDIGSSPRLASHH